jgi:zinc protease
MNRRRRPCVALLSVFAIGCAALELPDKPVLKPYDLTQTDYSTSITSGLRVVVQEDHSSKMVTVVALYGSGSTSDPKGVEGLAHIVEHLAFRTRPGGAQLWDHLKRMGANFNAWTEYDFTGYYTIAHKENLNTMLQLEAWRLARTLDGVTEDVFATEREVVRNEIRQRGETTVGSRLIDTLAAQMYPASHLLSRSVGGDHKSLSAATLGKAQAFAKEHYRPDNCTIVISGDVDPKEVGALLGKWPAELLFGPEGPDGAAVPPRQRIIDRPIPPVPAPATTKLTRHKGPIDQPILMLGWSAPGGRRGHDAHLMFLAARLNLAFYEGLTFKEDDDIEGLGAFVFPTANGSMFLAFVGLKPGADPERARARVLDTLVGTWTTEFGPILTESVRWLAATSLVQIMAEPIFMAMGLSEHLGSTGRSSVFKDSFDDLRDVKDRDALAFAHKYLRRERAAAVYFEPESDMAPKFVGGADRAGGKAKAQHKLEGAATEWAGDLGPDEILKIARPPGLAQATRWRLPSGLQMVAMPHGSAPVAQVRLSLPGGDAMTQPYGLASWASGFAETRCREHGDLTPVGGWISNWTGETSSTFTVDVLAGNLPNGLAVLSDQVACRQANEELFVLHRDRMLKSVKKFYDRRAKLPGFLAAKTLWGELYPGHPYGVSDMDPDTLKPVAYSDAAAWVQGHYRPGGAVAVVTGDIDIAQVKALADKYLLRWAGGGGRSTVIAPPDPPTARKVFLIDRPEATQATVSIGCRLAPTRIETLPAYDVAEALINEQAWAVRENWGATYGMHGSVSKMPGGAAHLILAGAIENQQLGPAVGQLLSLVAQVGSDGLPEPLFLLKRWDVAREFVHRFSTSDGLAGEVLSAVRHNWPDDVWDQYPKHLAATTRKHIQDIMQPCVGREIVTIVGKAEVLRPQLDKADIQLEAR